MFKLTPASLQTFIDPPKCVLEGGVQYSTVHIQFNAWRLAVNTLNITCNIPYCNQQVHKDFLITLYYDMIMNTNFFV